MISGRNRDTTYEHTENLNPGKTSSVTAAPPRTWRRSRTTTFFPARARYAAVVRPLWPPPITIASYFVLEAAISPLRLGRRLNRWILTGVQEFKWNCFLPE